RLYGGFLFSNRDLSNFCHLLKKGGNILQIYYNERMQKIYFDKNFSPAATLECGQVFRYKNEGDCYSVLALDKECRIYRDGDGYYMLSDDENFFKNYFDFDGKY